MKLLTKSRYKLGLECPNKLYYTRKESYANLKKEDTFLEALAQGGFQVEELARMHYPEGILIEGKDWDYEYLWNKTKELLQLENVVIFEAAFMFEGLFIRVDVLVKKGNRVELIEVKSKSFNPGDPNIFIGKKGGMVAGWKPYLFDIAFQQHVIHSCYPAFRIDSYIMMADKSKHASIDGLNQLFRIEKKADKSNRTGITKKISTIEEAGDPVLGRMNVTDIVESIQSDRHKYHENLGFYESIKMMSEAYAADQYLNWPTSFRSCRDCEFKTTEENDSELRSGFKECFVKQHQWTTLEFAKPSTMDIWYFTQGKNLFEEDIFFIDQLSPDMINMNEEAGILSRTERQWLQIEKTNAGDLTPYLDKDGLEEAMAAWNFPLHFIDFETSAVALPFHKGRRPYEQTAFQFSHHIYHADGRIEHATEFLHVVPGTFPNFEFVRELKKALEKDDGTIFKYAAHENTILNAIYEQLKESNEPDRDALMEFIRLVSHSKKDNTDIWKGPRDMVDLCQIIKWFYYNPYTNGSNSMKAILPAILQSSSFLQEKYEQSLSEIGVGSRNFEPDHFWLKKVDGKVQNPYKMLPGLFEEWSDEEIEKTLSDMDGIAEGGAALTAYSKLQFMDMPEAERTEISKALLKYCELDTLAMVMVYEHFVELVEGGGKVPG